MSTPLLATKTIVPPPRPGRVARLRLLDRLEAGLQAGKSLTLVSAPPGFGKTTLLAEWIAAGAHSAAWLSLDESDNNPDRFFAYLISALQTVEPGLGRPAQSLLSNAQNPPFQAVTTLLINDLAAFQARFVLVLDDFHLINEKTIIAAIDFLIRNQPLNLHLVISGREDPPLPLPRLRVRGSLTEIRQSDLRFNLDEAGSFLQDSMGLALEQPVIAALENRTEGWVAGLQLAALSLQNVDDPVRFVSDFAGEDALIMDYLVQEVLQRQSADIRTFLLRTSILPVLSASLCDRLRSIPQASPGSESVEWNDSQEMLEMLDRANLFISALDHRREWYRYHRLFADLLRYRLHREAPGVLPILHRRASEWFEESGDLDQAMQHALAMPDSGRAVELAERYMMPLIGGSRVATYLGWVRSIPDEVITTRPYLCAGCGWAYVLTGQVETAERYLQAGEKGLAGFEGFFVPPLGRSITPQELEGQYTAIRAYGARLRGDFHRALELTRLALDQLPPEALSIRCVLALNLGLMHLENDEPDQAIPALQEAVQLALQSEENLYAGLSALAIQGDIAATKGEFRRAVELYRQAIRFGSGEDPAQMPMPVVAMAYGGLVDLHFLRNEMDSVEELLQKSLPLVEQVGSPEWILSRDIFHARYAALRGDQAKVKEIVQRWEDPERLKVFPGYNQLNWILARTELYLIAGEIEKAAEWITKHGIEERLKMPSSGGSNARTFPSWARLPGWTILARLCYHQGRLPEAQEILEKVEALSRKAGYIPAQVEAQAYLAAIAHLQKHGEQALSILEQVLELSEVEGIVRPFLDIGPPMPALLRQAITRGMHASWASRLLSHFPAKDEDPAGAVASVGERIEMVEPLTGREQQILRLLAAGLNSSEVADELVLSVHTVRSYIKDIYQKLDAHSREEAIQKGRQAGVI